MDFTQSAKKVLDLASTEANVLGKSHVVGSEHILLGLIMEKDGLAAKVLRTNGIDEQTVRKMIEENIDSSGDVLVDEPDGFSPSARRIVEASKQEATNLNSNAVGTEHILMAILKDKDCLAIRILNTIKGINLRKMYMDMVQVIGTNDKAVGQRSFTPMSNTPVLDNFSRDLTALSRSDLIDPVIGREKEINRIIQILARRTKNNPCIIGEPGVGKTSIAEGLANLIVKGQVPMNMRDKRVVSLDIGGLVAGTQFRGQFENRIKGLIDEVKREGNIILFIDEVHNLVGTGDSEGSMSAANILKPALSRGEVQVIGATTFAEYRKHIEKDAALDRRFQIVQLDEPSELDSIKILNGLKSRYEQFHNIHITEEAVEAAVKLSSRYIPDRKLPDKAIDLLDEACAKLKINSFVVPKEYQSVEQEIANLDNDIEKSLIAEDFDKVKNLKAKKAEKQKELEDMKKLIEKNKEDSVLSINEEDIADIVASWTSIPVTKITEDENKKLANLEEELHKRVIGQNDAVVSISKAIRRNRVGLKPANRPIGNFLFLGPTGVGKTELCKSLAYVMFGSEDNLIRVDMSEYMERHTVSKLIGSPPGYVGYDEGGQLTEKIRRKPYTVVLFDEIEKAHPDIFNVLLQMLDEGHVTDAQGRKVSFKNSIIIMTSNVGASQIMEPKTLGFDVIEGDPEKDYKRMKDNVMSEVKKTFKPEFINRIDDIIVFHKLSKQDISDILDLQLKDIANRTKEGMNIDMTLDDKAKEYILKEGYDEQYGARKLKRVLTDKLEDLLADEKIAGNIDSGDKIVVTFDKDKLKVNKK